MWHIFHARISDPFFVKECTVCVTRTGATYGIQYRHHCLTTSAGGHFLDIQCNSPDPADSMLTTLAELSVSNLGCRKEKE